MVSSFGRGFDSRQLHVKLPSATYVMNKSNDFLMASLLLVKRGSFLSLPKQIACYNIKNNKIILFSFRVTLSLQKIQSINVSYHEED